MPPKSPPTAGAGVDVSGQQRGVSDLESELAEAWDHVHQLTKALTGLTCGGSEFFIRRRGRYIADIQACVAYVQRRDQNAHQTILRVHGEKKKAETTGAELLEALTALLADSYPVGTGENGEVRERAIAAIARSGGRDHG